MKQFAWITLFLSCFLSAGGLGEGTLVKTTNGLTKVENLKIDDEILGFNFETKEVDSQKITNIKSLEVGSYCYLRLNDKLSFIVDVNQKFFIPSKYCWIKSLNLLPTENLDFFTNTKNLIDIEVVNKKAKLYLITTTPNHNFFLKNNILVHNMHFELAEKAITVAGPVLVKAGMAVATWLGAELLADNLDTYFIRSNKNFKNIETNNNDKNHIIEKNGEKHGFKGPGQDPEKWWQRILREIEKAREQNKLKSGSWMIEVEQFDNLDFGNLVIRGFTSSKCIRIGTAFLRNRF